MKLYVLLYQTTQGQWRPRSVHTTLEACQVLWAEVEPLDRKHMIIEIPWIDIARAVDESASQ